MSNEKLNSKNKIKYKKTKKQNNKKIKFKIN